MHSLATAVGRLSGERAFYVLAQAQQLEKEKGIRYCHFEIGEPDFDTPLHIKNSARRALEEHRYTHYTGSQGLPELREAIAAHISRSRRIPVGPEEVVVGHGAKPIIFASIVALVEIGDEVIISNPSYPAYESAIRFAGGIPVEVPLLEEKDFVMDIDFLLSRVTNRTKLIVLNSPQNPTGGVLMPDDLKAIAEVALQRDLWVISDEIYSEIIYDGEHHSIASIPGMKERTVLIDGFSKTYAMTGWRLGYGVMNPNILVKPVTLMVNNMISCTAPFIQVAGIEALQGSQEEVKKMMAEYRRRRDAIVDGLNAIPGIRCRSPRGAFYVFPNIRSFGKPAKEIADYLLEEGGVALLPGTDFGSRGEGYLRLCFARSVDEIQLGMERMKTALAKMH